MAYIDTCKNRTIRLDLNNSLFGIASNVPPWTLSISGRSEEETNLFMFSMTFNMFIYVLPLAFAIRGISYVGTLVNN